MSNPIISTHCPSCSELKKYVDQQGELISQLMRIIAQTHEKVVVIEKNYRKLTNQNVHYSCEISEPQSTSIYPSVD